MEFVEIVEGGKIAVLFVDRWVGECCEVGGTSGIKRGGEGGRVL